MNWYDHPLRLLAGMLLTNGVPHFVHGLSGTPFQSPFASPRGIGESSPLVNFYWGLANLVGGAVLLVAFAPQSATDYVGLGAVAAGVIGMGTLLALHFGKVRSKAFIDARAATGAKR